MSPFQILAVGTLGGLFLRDIWRWSRSPATRMVRTLRCLVWLGAAAAIADPDLVQLFAQTLGIGRGADVVLYVFVLAFLWASFSLYTWCTRLEREVTDLSRHLAIRDAIRGPRSFFRQEPASLRDN